MLKIDVRNSITLNGVIKTLAEQLLKLVDVISSHCMNRKLWTHQSTSVMCFPFDPDTRQTRRKRKLCNVTKQLMTYDFLFPRHCSLIKPSSKQIYNDRVCLHSLYDLYSTSPLIVLYWYICVQVDIKPLKHMFLTL